MRTNRLTAAAIAVSLLVACSAAKKDDPRLISEFEFAGCDELRAGPACEINGERALTFWIRTLPTAKLRIQVDGETVDAPWSEVDGGRQTTIKIEPKRRVIRIIGQREAGGVQYEASRALPIVRWDPPEQLVQAGRFRTENSTMALAMLDSLAETAAPRVLGEIETLRGKIAYLAGDNDAAFEHRRKAADISKKLGLMEKQLRDLTALAFIADRIRFDAKLTRSVLDEMGAVPNSVASTLLVDFSEGLWARLTGDIRAAERRFARVERGALRLKRWRLWVGALIELADLRTTLGHHEAAFKLFEEPREDIGTCLTAHWRAAQAWAGLMAREVDFMPPFEPRPKATLALASLKNCEDTQLPNVMMMVALSHAQQGESKDARKWLEPAKTVSDQPPTDVQWWMADVAARIALLEEKYTEAKDAYRQLNAIATQRGVSAAQWRATVGLARVEEASGHDRGALDAYKTAEALLDRQGTQAIFLSELAVSTHAQREVAKRYAALLLRQNKPRKAIEVLQRQANRRLMGVSLAIRVASLAPAQRLQWDQAIVEYARLRSIEDSLDGRQWGESPSTSAETQKALATNTAAIRRALDAAFALLGPQAVRNDEWPKLAPEEMLLGFDQTSQGWVGFSLGHGALKVIPLDLPNIDLPDAALSQLLLQPFAEDLEAYKKIRIAARGPMEELDFHSLPYNGAPLNVTHRITYSVGSPRPTVPTKTTDTALVVADPDGSLPGARDEGRAVTESLRKLGLNTQLLIGPDLDRQDILRKMDVSLLHWAGHGRQVDKTSDGLGSAVLTLSPTADLTAGDVLTLPSVPQRVILAGCETSPANASHLGVGQAFILAGSEAVVATTRPVKDADARQMAEALYRGNKLSDLGEALRDAQLRLKDKIEDWAAFRVIVP